MWQGTEHADIISWRTQLWSGQKKSVKRKFWGQNVADDDNNPHQLSKALDGIIHHVDAHSQVKGKKERKVNFVNEKKSLKSNVPG